MKPVCVPVEVLRVSRKCCEESLRRNSHGRVRLVVQHCVVSLAEIACDRANVILRRSMEIVYFANTPPTAASCHRTIIRFGFASFPFTAWFVGSSRPTLRRSRKRRNNEREREKEEKESAVARKGGWEEGKTWAKAKPSERQEEKRDTTNQSKAHLARATDSPRPCNPSNSPVRPARHSSRALIQQK